MNNVARSLVANESKFAKVCLSKLNFPKLLWIRLRFTAVQWSFLNFGDVCFSEFPWSAQNFPKVRWSLLNLGEFLWSLLGFSKRLSEGCQTFLKFAVYSWRSPEGTSLKFTNMSIRMNMCWCSYITSLFILRTDSRFFLTNFLCLLSFGEKVYGTPIYFTLGH